MTNTLLEFLLFLLDNYDMKHKDIIVKGVSSTFRLLESKGVVQSFDLLTSYPTLSPSLKEGLWKLGSSKGFLPILSQPGRQIVLFLQKLCIKKHLQHHLS